MNNPAWDEQLDVIIKNAKNAPRQIGVFIDKYKEDYFMRRLRAELPDTEFELKLIGPLIKGCKKTNTIIIKRKQPRDLAAN